MPWAESNSFVSVKKILWLGLALRLVLFALALQDQHWVGSDTEQYLGAAQFVCSGHWGGDPGRTPLYSWFLCALSPQISIALFVQSMLVWVAGFFLARFTRNPLLIACWVFDPVLLVYSNIIMSDALFAVTVLALALSFWQYLEKQTLRWAFFFALALSLVLLTRPIGIFLGAVSIAILLSLVLKKKAKLHQMALIVITVAGLIAPRVYWNHTQFQFWGLARQGFAWQESVAGVIDNSGSGLDYVQAEQKWFKDHPAHDRPFLYRYLFTHFKEWVWLSLKGMARVLVGHVNVEWTKLFTGQAPIGPGWFKAAENRAGPHVSGSGIIFWALGLVATLVYCLAVYWACFRAVLNRVWSGKPTSSVKLFMGWTLASIACLAAAPQVWGDARFRAALWPLVLVLWAFSEHRSRSLVDPRA